MATTATLNGGPTGGLHATPTLIHSENPPPEETCRAESNSSFESGNDEILQHSGVLQGDNNPGAWSGSSSRPCHHDGLLDRSFDSESQAMDYRGGGSMDAKGKKRRKQSRPVRIPATEMSALGAREHGSLLSESAGTGSEGDEAGDLSSERELYHPEGNKGTLSGAIKQEKSDDYEDDDTEEGELHSNSRQQLPLNLTGKYEPDSESGGQQQSLLAAQSSSLLSSSASVLTSCLNVQPSGSNSSIETDKTEAAGQGTKSSPSPLSRVVLGSSSPQISRQFSPPSFSITNSSPFSALFPTASGNPVSNYFQHHQQQQQQQPHSQNLITSGILQSQGNPPPGTPNSTSSTGSNQNGQGGGSTSVSGMPPHRIFNPEAYCDLCNKEFCNKYFLKTHKANKHGVYSELPSSASLASNQILAAAISSSPSSSSFLNLTAPHASSSSAATNPLSQCVPQQQAAVTTVVSSASSSSATSTAALLKSGNSSTTAAESSFTSAFSTGGAGDKNGSSSGSCAASLQRESFCELCQKEFCNKYFLKRHKAKIHGVPIPPESLIKPGGSGGIGCSKSSSSSRQGFTNGMSEGVKRSSEEGSLPGLATLQIGLDALGLDLVTKHLEENSGGVSQGESGQRDDADMGHSDESNAPPNSLNNYQSELMFGASGGVIGGSGESARLRSPENLGENSSFKLSSVELKPQQLGTGMVVSNAENTCQFCFREFPSQQLLRSHIIKKHRLLLQSAFPTFLLPFHPIPPTAFDDQATESAVLDSNGNTTEVDYECNICNRSFQTIYLLRMHKSYFHPESEPESSDPLTSKLMSEAASIFSQAAGGGGGGGKSSNGREENEGDTDQGFDSDVEAETKSDSANKSSANTVEHENRGEATSDSDDLRRLQTMILELNRVPTSAVAWSPPLTNVSTSPTTAAAAAAAAQFAGQAPLGSASLVCPICSKEFYSSYFLQQHIQHYHASNAIGVPGGLPESGQAVRVKIESPLLGEITSVSNASKKMNETGSVSGSSGGSSTNSQKERMDGVMTETTANIMSSPTFLTPGPKGSAGSGNPIKTEVPGSASAGGSLAGGGVKRPSPSLSRSYCTICHKELCNKYFMRTHMLKMHGISIESSTGLGGVTCDICNKELCSKYFLKVHKQNTHGIIEDGPSPPNPSTPGPPPQTLANFPIVTPPIMNLSTGTSTDTGSPLGQGDVSPSLLPKEQNERYFNHFSEVCPLCGRRFRSSKWLKSHLQSDHGQEGREKWKAIEKSVNLQRRSPKMSKGSSNGSQTKNSGGGSSGGGSSNSGKSGNNSTKPCSSKDGNKCALCGFTSGDAEVMRSHLIKEHGTQLGSGGGHGGVLGDSLASTFPEGSPGLVLDPLTMLFQKMEGGTNKLYRCSYCPFTTSLLVYLYAHERTHTGLANSVTNPNAVNATSTPDAKCPFQCPMCFQTFQQPDTFQQHLIGHQMSGVLAPFFTPTAAAAAAAAAASSSCHYALLSNPSENDPTGGELGGRGGGLLSSLPLLNGGNAATNSSLYLALSSTKAQNMSRQEQDDDDEKSDKSEHDEEEEDEDDNAAADLTIRKRQLRRDSHMQQEDDVNEESPCDGPTPKKLSKISHFRCTCCHARFKSREACISHIRQEHKGKRVVFKVISTALRGHDMMGHHHHHHHHHSNRHKKNFRCRKCKFTCSTYTSLMVHSKLQHSILRPGYVTPHGTEEENESPFLDGSAIPTTCSIGGLPSSLTSGSSTTAAASVATNPLLGKSCGGVGLWKTGNLPEGRGVPQEGTIGDGEFMMQGFLLTSSEEESSNQSGYFVPSLVYLPVREKVSQSIRVSFSLTPTS